FDVVGECADGSEGIAAVDFLTPDVVLMDVRMPLVDAVRATRELRRRDGSPPVLALTTFDDDEVLAGVLRAGASGFLLKGVAAEDLHRAVRVVADGGAWLDRAAAVVFAFDHDLVTPLPDSGSPWPRPSRWLRP